MTELEKIALLGIVSAKAIAMIDAATTDPNERADLLEHLIHRLEGSLEFARDMLPT